MNSPVMGALELFRSGGFWNILILLIGAGGIVLAILGAVLAIYASLNKKGRLGLWIVTGLLVGAALLLVLVAGTNHVVGSGDIEAALAHAPPESRSQLRAHGEDMLNFSLLLTGVCFVPIFLGACVTGIRALVWPKEEGA